MVTADQLVAHVVGDYVLQSDWMASHKARHSLPAIVHALAYSIPFVWLTRSPMALLIICGSHFAIDRWRLARYISFAVNYLSPPPHAAWSDCSQTGHAPGRPEWVTHWVLTAVDNTLHVLINAWVLSRTTR
jgi:hypothetical protein